MLPPGVAAPPDVGAATQAITPVVLAERYDDPTPAGAVGGSVYVTGVEAEDKNAV